MTDTIGDTTIPVQHTCNGRCPICYDIMAAENARLSERVQVLAEALERIIDWYELLSGPYAAKWGADLAIDGDSDLLTAEQDELKAIARAALAAVEEEESSYANPD